MLSNETKFYVINLLAYVFKKPAPVELLFLLYSRFSFEMASNLRSEYFFFKDGRFCEIVFRIIHTMGNYLKI